MRYRYIELNDGSIYACPEDTESATEHISYKDEVILELHNRIICLEYEASHFSEVVSVSEPSCKGCKNLAIQGEDYIYMSYDCIYCTRNPHHKDFYKEAQK